LNTKLSSANLPYALIFIATMYFGFTDGFSWWIIGLMAFMMFMIVVIGEWAPDWELTHKAELNLLEAKALYYTRMAEYYQRKQGT